MKYIVRIMSPCSKISSNLLIRDERGAALITSVLIISILAVLLVEFAYNSRLQLRMAKNFSQHQKAYFLARGGVDAAADLLLYDSQHSKIDFYSPPIDFAGGTAGLEEFGSLEEIWSWAAQGTPLSYPIGDGLLVIKISDEEGKVNLNLLEDKRTREIAERLFEFLISTAPEMEIPISAREAVDSIQEWIDGDQEVTPDSQGVENEFYQALDPPYSAKDGRMDSITELRLVSGITTHLYQNLVEGAGIEAKNSDALNSPLVTVFPQHSSDGKINVNTAPSLVLESLHSSFSSSLAQEIIEFRIETPFRSTGEFLNHFVSDPQARLNLQKLISVKSDTFSVSSTGIIGDIAVTVKAVLTRLPKQTQAKIVYWRVEG